MTDATEHSALNAAGAVRPPLHHVDFDRPVVSILGLPFDAIDIAEAVRRIREAAFTGRRCFVSTPNLNFAMTARHDAAFRGSLLRSDLSLADGMPLVWIAQLLGSPVPQRVSGADVFAALQVHAGPPLGIYLFGGPSGVAAKACDEINRKAGGLRCVGFDEAGFGSLESMSEASRIDRINASGAHFVVVSLGAKKGQAWIEHNAPRLNAPVLSHLGAVVNFAAGRLRRAPRWMQTGGLEWLWRIREEPSLWRRYAGDGFTAARLLLPYLLPDAIVSRRLAASPSNAMLDVEVFEQGLVLRLRGAWRDADAASLRAALVRCDEAGSRVTIDLSGVTALGATCVGLLLLARGWFDQRQGLEITGASGAVVASLRRKLAFDALFGTQREPGRHAPA